MSDLTPIESMPVTTLDLTNTPVKSVAALKGSKVTWLELTGTAVSDLTPLKETKWRYLGIVKSSVVNYGVLRGMTIESVSCTIRNRPTSARSRGSRACCTSTAKTQRSN